MEAAARLSGRALALSVLIVFAGSWGAAHAEPQKIDWKSWGAVSDTLRSVQRGERRSLSAPFIVEASERVVVDGIELQRGQYEINYQKGVLRITVQVPEEAVAVVSYTRLPFLLDSVYSLRGIEFASSGSGAPPRPVEPLAQTEPKSGLEPTGALSFGGMKSVSFNVGSNRSATFDQFLRATVEGNLTPSIQVKALLSDDNIPIQPEGNTQELEYLDKVYIEITGTRAGASLGDIAYSNSLSDFNSFRRELKGAAGSVQVVGKTRVEAAGGSSKGVFRTVKFRGTDQLQGPYELLTVSATSNEVIIAGTEKVFFDGALLVRGDNRDYTIDYDRGMLTFTARRHVTADTEIAVDFESTQVEYDRTSVFAGAVTQDVPGGLKFGVLAAVETDDADRPKSLLIGEEDREVIEDAGDDEEKAVGEGATFVGEGQGNYIRVPEDPAAGTPEYFVFDDTTGSYDVIFTSAGAGRGDYVLDGVSVSGIPVYRFVGVGKGDQVVGKRLPLPRTHAVYGARLSKESPGIFDFDVQYNVSDFDANSLSTLDDEDNVGDAGEARVRFKKIPVVVGELELSGLLSAIQDRFRSLEKSRTSYFYRDWNLENDPLQGREVLQEIGSAFARSEALKLEYRLGRLDRDDFDGVKQEFRGAYTMEPGRGLAARVFSTDTEGKEQERTRRYGNLSLSYAMLGIVPSAEVEAEEYLAASAVLPDSGISYERFAVRVANRREGALGYTVFAEQRDTDEIADTTAGWVWTRTDQTMGGSIASRSLRSLQGEVVFTHRIRDDKLAGGKRTSDLARLNGFVRGESIGLRSTLEYEIGQNRERMQSKSVVFVGEGNGDYNELGEPVGKGRGAYTVVYLPTQETIPTQRVGFTWNLAWRMPPGKPAGGLWSWIGSNVSVDHSLSVREETTSEDAYKVYLLFPSALQRDESTLAGVVSLRQEWSLLNSYPGVSLTVRYQRDDEEENRFNDVNEERFYELDAARIDRSLVERLSANFEVRREVKRRGGEGLPEGTGSTYDVTGWTLAAGWGLRLAAGSTFDGELELRDQEDSESGSRERAAIFRPRLTWYVSKALNVYARYEVTRYTLPVDAGVKPLFFSNPGVAQRWALTPNLRFSKVISLLATYQGRSERAYSGERIVDHELTMETRAYF